MEGNPVCVDTDICVDFLRGKDLGFSLLIKLLERFEPCITSITAFELYLGQMKMKRKDRMEGFLAHFVILPFDHKAAKVSAEIQASLDKRGVGIGLPDPLIAGACISGNIPLLTSNKRHFERAKGMGLELLAVDW